MLRAVALLLILLDPSLQNRHERAHVEADGSVNNMPYALWHAAAADGNEATVQSLMIQHRAIIDYRNSGGQTALLLATLAGRLHIVRALLEAGAAVDLADSSGCTPLHAAAFTGHVAILEALLAAGAEVGLSDQDGDTPLHAAADMAQDAIIRLLLEYGALADVENDDGCTPLLQATVVGHVKAVRALLDGGATVDASTKAGCTFRQAAYAGVGGETALHAAASTGQEAVMVALLDARATLSVQDADGHTALHAAASSGHVGCIHALLRAGAPLEPRNADGGTPLLAAAARGHVAAVRSLLEGGAPVGGSNAEGRSALHVAAMLGHAPLVSALLSAGADAGGRSTLLRATPLESALYSAAQGHGDSALRVVGALLGSATNDSSSRASSAASAAAFATASAAHPWTGQTPLHAAVYLRHQALIDLLLSRGAAHDERSRLQAVHRQWQDARAVAGAVAARSLADLSVQLDTVQEKKDEEDAAAAATAAAAAKLAGQGEARAQPEAEPWVGRAIRLWREQGVVVFPSLLDEAAVQTLRDAALATLRNASVTDRSTVIRASRAGAVRTRQLKALPISVYRDVLDSLSSALAPFLSRGLQSDRLLVLESGALRTLPGAASQTWHRDNVLADARLAAVQISLGDTEAAEHGALRVRPASHNAEFVRMDEAGVAIAPLRRGTVVLYSPNLVHRGGGYTDVVAHQAHEVAVGRLVVTLTLLGVDALLPFEHPITVSPEDAGRWWVEGGRVRDRGAAVVVQ